MAQLLAAFVFGIPPGSMRRAPLQQRFGLTEDGVDSNRDQIGRIAVFFENAPDKNVLHDRTVYVLLTAC